MDRKQAKKYDAFMQKVFKDNEDLFNDAVWEWLYEGWELQMEAQPEQIAAALLMEAKTQDSYVKDGDSDPSFPKRLRDLAYSIIDHYHKPQPEMFKIIYIDGDKQERLLDRFEALYETAVKKTVELARREASRLPNDPKVDQSGPDEVSIWIGQYRHASYRLERD